MSARLAALAERFDDFVNPVFLKELRQAVRGRFIVSALVLSLVAEVITVGTMYVSDELSQFRTDSAPAGPQTFAVLYSVIFVACLLFVPLYCGIRMMSERSDANTDLMYITTISPRAIVLGKMAAVFSFVALLFGAALPFLAFAYVLRGLDLLPSILSLGFALLVVMTEAVLALFIGALPMSRPFKIVMALVILVLAMTGPIAAFPVLESIRTMFNGPVGDTRAVLLGVFGSLLFADAVLVVLTTALLTPPPANRALPVRVMLVIVWMASLALAVRGMMVTKNLSSVEAWAWIQIGIASLVLLSAAGEREWWGPRVARTIPRPLVGRALAFLFYSGSAGGILWAAMMFAATVTATALAGVYHQTVNHLTNDLVIMTLDVRLATASAAFLAYTLSAVAIHRRFLARKVPQKNTWALTVLLLVIFAVIVPLVATVRYIETPKFQRAFMWATMANPFAEVETLLDASVRAIVIGLWLGAIAIVTFRWMAAQWSRFRRSEAGPAAPVAGAQLAVTPTLPELASE